jgi:hypothetical protein
VQKRTLSPNKQAFTSRYIVALVTFKCLYICNSFVYFGRKLNECVLSQLLEFRCFVQIPPMMNYSMEGRTYRYFKGPGVPLYPFGYGLSYSGFTYDGLIISPTTVKAGTDLTITVNVTNVGPHNSDEVCKTALHCDAVNCIEQYFVVNFVDYRAAFHLPPASMNLPHSHM